jgi:hypothetical protein
METLPKFRQREQSHCAVAIFSVLLGLFAVACGSEGDPPKEEQGQTGFSTGSECPDDSTLTWTTFAEGFFANYCIRCHSDSSPDGRHGAPPGYNWDDLDSVREHARQIDRMAAAGPSATNTFMPPNNPRPTDDLRLMLGEWLACGQPE